MERPKDFSIPYTSEYRKLVAWEKAMLAAIAAGWLPRPGAVTAHNIGCPGGEVNTAAVYEGVVLFEIHQSYLRTAVAFNKDLPVPTPPEPVVDESLPY